MPLYEAKSKEIQAKGARTEYVGGQFYISHGQLAYDQGIAVSAKVPDWSKDLMDAINWGPYTFSFAATDPRKEWLETFKYSIQDECPAANEFLVLRSMLKELMEDGSFCPGNKILEPSKMLGSRKAFKKVLIAAVKDQRFPQCQTQAVSDDSTREVKDKGRSPSVIERTPLRNSTAQ